MNDIFERFLMATVGLTLLAGGGIITRSSLDAKNLIETALFGLLGVGVGIFLIVSALCGPPG